MKRHASFVAAIALALPVAALCSGCSAEDTAEISATQEQPSGSENLPELGLMTTLPILWAEGDDFGAMLSADTQGHWALDVLREGHDVAAVDMLNPQALAPLELLVLAQPRMLSAQENVALDDWVRGGGHVLVFADPMLTGHSQYGIGDKRRPQDVALLDTILARWGLALQAATPRPQTAHIPLGDGELPLEAEGSFVRQAPAGGAQATCRDRVSSTLVVCEIGAGRAVLLADAALLELHDGPEEPMIVALQELLAMAGEASGDGLAQKHGTSGE